jgi:hypothetical protein
MSFVKRSMPTFILLIVAIVLIGTIDATPVFANLCQISNITYNYPQQVLPNQSFQAAVNVTGDCDPGNSYYYVLRVDLNDMSGQVLSSNYASIGYNWQNWQVTVSNHLTAPMNVGSWQVQFNVYVFANVNAGQTMDSRTTKWVTIQVGTTVVLPGTSVVTAPPSTVVVTQTQPQTTVVTQPPSQTVVGTQPPDYTLIAIVIVAAAVIVGLLMNRRIRRPVPSTTQTGMPFCKSCGKQIPVNLQFCEFCGSAQ